MNASLSGIAGLRAVAQTVQSVQLQIPSAQKKAKASAIDFQHAGSRTSGAGRESRFGKFVSRAFRAGALGMSLALSACAKPDTVPVDLPAACVQINSPVQAMQDFAKSLGVVMVKAAPSVNERIASWDAVCAADRAAPPSADDRFALGGTWGDFMQGAKDKRGLELVAWVQKHWGDVQQNHTSGAGELSTNWETRASIVHGSGMLMSHAMHATQSSIAAGKCFTLRDLSKGTMPVWVASAEMPDSGGHFFAACAEVDGETWIMPAGRGEAYPASELRQRHPGIKLDYLFADGRSMAPLLRDGVLDAGSFDERARDLRAIVKEFRRLGRADMPEPELPVLTIEPGKPLS